MKKALGILFLNSEGKISWTTIAAFFALLIGFHTYIDIWWLGKEYSAALLQFALEIILAGLGVRGAQRGLQYLGEGVGSITKKSKAENNTVAVKEKINAAAPEPKQEQIGSFLMPAQGNITSTFRPPHRPNHHGIDIAAKGAVPILATWDGEVVKSYTSASYGECVVIQHNVNGEIWQSVYAHLQTGTRIDQGIKVIRGQLIGMMGNTGRSSGQHLHFELHKGKWNPKKTNAVDPLQYLSNA